VEEKLIEIARLIGNPVYIIFLVVFWLLYRIITDSLSQIFLAVNKQTTTLEKLVTLIEVMVYQGQQRNNQ